MLIGAHAWNIETFSFLVAIKKEINTKTPSRLGNKSIGLNVRRSNSFCQPNKAEIFTLEGRHRVFTYNMWKLES